LKDATGVNVASASDFEAALVNDDALESGALLLDHLDIAIVDADPDQVQSMTMAVADADSPILSVEPEMYAIPFEDEELGQALLTAGGREYLRGYADAIQGLVARLVNGNGAASADVGIEAGFADTATLTWGLQATRVDRSRCSGAGIRVAVLDTGFDLAHPDFVGRAIVPASFVPGQPVQDGHSHGTHCIGTSCGPNAPPGGMRRYGIAYQATILVGKVLNNLGSGQQGWILAGINWAIENKAHVISMSLGSPVAMGQGYSPAYEAAAQAALNHGCIIVAAAGNSGNQPVGSPANCPSVLAVAAVGQDLQRAPFSCMGLNPNGGEVNIAAPGVNVFSSVPMPARYGLKSGTSMATPHVAGIAALYAQNTGLHGKALWQKLVTTTQNIGQTPQAVGSGLVQAPTCSAAWGPRPPRPIPFPQPPVHIPPVPPLPVPPLPGPPPPIRQGE
jgi:hypothetical protein